MTKEREELEQKVEGFINKIDSNEKKDDRQQIKDLQREIETLRKNNAQYKKKESAKQKKEYSNRELVWEVINHYYDKKNHWSIPEIVDNYVNVYSSNVVSSKKQSLLADLLTKIEDIDCYHQGKDYSEKNGIAFSALSTAAFLGGIALTNYFNLSIGEGIVSCITLTGTSMVGFFTYKKRKESKFLLDWSENYLEKINQLD